MNRYESVRPIGRAADGPAWPAREPRIWLHLFERAGFGLVVFDAATHRIAAVNPMFARVRGYAPDELVGQPADVLYPAHLHPAWRERRAEIDRAPHTVIETTHVTRDGRPFPVLLDISVTHDAEDRAEWVIAYARDVSDRVEMERELRLAAVAFQTQAALVLADESGVIQRVNDAFSRLSGYAAEEAQGQQVAVLLGHPRESWLPPEAPADGAAGPWQRERWLRPKSGPPVVVRAIVSAIPADSRVGGRVQLLYSMLDVSAEHEARARVQYQRFYDPLTDLPNRHFLCGQLQEMDGDGILILLDVDHFRRVNDLHDYHVGDRVLVELARRLRALARLGATACRLIGMGFGILVRMPAAPADGSGESAGTWIGRVQALFHAPFDTGTGQQLVLTASIGWTLIVPGPVAAESALREAEIAVGAAKKAGRDCVRQFRPALQQALERREALVMRLRRAIVRGEFALHLQVQVDASRRTVGAEALLRWEGEDGAPVPPDAFVPMAEETGLIVPLGAWALERGCAVLADWAKSPATRRLSLAVNVSPKQFAERGFAAAVERIVAASGADPARLTLELTESCILGDVADVARKLGRLRGAGIRLALDDFGIGYSSLSYLSALPVDQLKIDRSFVEHLPGHRRGEMVVRAIVSLARGLDLEVVAEGVESEAQHRYLCELGCDSFQGYLHGRAMSPLMFAALHGDAAVAA